MDRHSPPLAIFKLVWPFPNPSSLQCDGSTDERTEFAVTWCLFSPHVRDIFWRVLIELFHIAGLDSGRHRRRERAVEIATFAVIP